MNLGFTSILFKLLNIFVMYVHTLSILRRYWNYIYRYMKIYSLDLIVHVKGVDGRTFITV